MRDLSFFGIASEECSVVVADYLLEALVKTRGCAEGDVPRRHDVLSQLVDVVCKDGRSEWEDASAFALHLFAQLGRSVAAMFDRKLLSFRPQAFLLFKFKRERVSKELFRTAQSVCDALNAVRASRDGYIAFVKGEDGSLKDLHDLRSAREGLSALLESSLDDVDAVISERAALCDDFATDARSAFSVRNMYARIVKHPLPALAPDFERLATDPQWVAAAPLQKLRQLQSQLWGGLGVEEDLTARLIPRAAEANSNFASANEVPPPPHFVSHSSLSFRRCGRGWSGRSRRCAYSPRVFSPPP